MRRDDERLIDIREAVQAALRFVEGRSAEDVATDELLAAALIQKITVIGEAAGRVSEARRGELPELPWREMIGMRNLVTHDYWQVDPALLWQTVNGDLPWLLAQLDRIGLPED
ncbi:MAG: HepT-like ribonuclease domain-containing protein [Candidatus Limnocylindria bacterium]